MKTNQITKEEFKAYEKVRMSGATNMLMITTVSELSGLSKDKVISVINSYDKLIKKYPSVRRR